MVRRAWAIVILGACSLYGSNPDAPICNGPGGGTIAVPVAIDPQTGVCEQSGIDPNPDPTCECGNCPEEGYSPGSGGSDSAASDWAPCSGACEALTESQCLESTTCHSAYLGSAFWHCFNMPPSGAIEGGNCASFNAQICSQHDDCVSDYADVPAGSLNSQFESCAAKIAPPACASLTTEAACAARTDCEPVYVGTDCTCTPTSCTCQVETFQACQAS